MAILLFAALAEFIFDCCRCQGHCINQLTLFLQIKHVFLFANDHRVISHNVHATLTLKSTCLLYNHVCLRLCHHHLKSLWSIDNNNNSILQCQYLLNINIINMCYFSNELVFFLILFSYVVLCKSYTNKMGEMYSNKRILICFYYNIQDT